MLHSKCQLEDHTLPLATPPDNDTDVSVCHQWSDGAVEEKEEERVMVVIVVRWHVWWWLTIQQAFPRSAILTWRDGKISSLVWSSLEADSFLCLSSSVRLSVPDNPISRSLCSTSGTWVSCDRVMWVSIDWRKKRKRPKLGSHLFACVALQPEVHKPGTQCSDGASIALWVSECHWNRTDLYSSIMNVAFPASKQSDCQNLDVIRPEKKNFFCNASNAHNAYNACDTHGDNVILWTRLIRLELCVYKSGKECFESRQTKMRERGTYRSRRIAEVRREWDVWGAITLVHTSCC